MKTKQSNYCSNCGEETNGAKFCPKCGTKQELAFTENVNNNTNSNTITINVGANNENQRQTITLEHFIKKAQTELDAKDFNSLRNTAKEIQTNYPTSFYGWYFEAVCITESPVDGTLGNLVKGLNAFSNALASSQIASNKAREGVEVKGAGFQALGILAMENFQGRIFKAIKCISGNNEEIASQQKLAFALLTSLTDKVWKAYNHKTCIGWFKGEKVTILRGHETKLNSFIINLQNAVQDTPTADCMIYKQFMGKNYGEYTRTLGTLKYKLNVLTHPTRKDTRDILKLFAEYCPKTIKAKKMFEWNDPKTIIQIVGFIVGMILSIIAVVAIVKYTRQPPVMYPYPY